MSIQGSLERRRREGHLAGGPLALILFLVLLGGCGGRGGARGGPEAKREGSVARPLEVYRDLGMLAGPQDFPAVASFATLAGPADSTYVLVGLSLSNNALRFQREGSGFAGEYEVKLAFLRDSVEVKRLERREKVRVGSFPETGRTEETIIFQALLALPPDRYTVHFEARDALSSRGLRAQDTLPVPAYGAAAATLAGPVLVYGASGRGSRTVAPELIVNPRRTVPYGGEPPRVYVEGYGVAAGEAVSVRVVGEKDTVLWQGNAILAGSGPDVRHALLEISSSSLPLGRAWIELLREGQVAPVRRTPLLVTISDQWMVANFEEVLQFLSYIAASEELDSLQAAQGAARREAWERFWKRRDPVPATPVNEFREDFFERVRIANDQFAEPGRAGWRTDRGEVFIVLGPPDHVLERHVGREEVPGQPNAQEWIYERVAGDRIELLFVDRTRFGRYELTASSEAAFRSTARKLRPEA